MNKTITHWAFFTLLFTLLVPPAFPQQTIVTLASSANPSVLGQSLTLTATVSPATASGKVTIYDGVAVLGSPTLANGAATIVTTLLPSGMHSLQAYYAGDSNDSPSGSAVLPQDVSSRTANSFFSAVNYASGASPTSMVMADFNGDGKPDLAVTGSQSLDILLGNGDGTFQAPVNRSTISGALAAGDFNGDGNTDLAVCNTSAAAVSVLLGNGDSTFRTPVNYLIGKSPFSIAIADFNGDGNADLVVATSLGISVLQGNGDGTFQPAVVWSPYSGSLAVGDFNGDGKPDIAFTNGSNVIVLLGNGDGSFQGPVASGSAPAAANIAVADFNGDGKADLAVGNSVGNNVSLLLGNGDGTFQPGVPYSAGVEPWFVAIGDFNGDGILDLAAANQGSNSISILLGNGDGTFQAATNYNAGTRPGPLVVGNFNGDGIADLAVANESGNNVSVLLGRLATPTTTVLTSTANPSPFGQPVTLTASVSPSQATGSVIFYDGTTVLGTQALTNGGAAAQLESALSIGTHQLTALYIGDQTYGTSTSPVLPFTITQASSTTALTSSPNPSTYGQTVTLRATVSPANAAGTVMFYDGTSSLGSASLSNGIAAVSTSTLAGGSHSLTATYLGNASATSSSAATTQVVNPAPTVLTLSSSLNPSRLLKTVTLTATVSAQLAGGTITFSDGSTMLGVSYVDFGIATLSIASLPAGSHSLSAVYSGNANYASSTSYTLIQIVTPATITTTTLTASANPASFGQPVTLTASISSPSATGRVTFYDGTTILGSAPVVNGQVTITTSLLPSGLRALKGYYGGDDANVQSTSPPLDLTVSTVSECGFVQTSSYGFTSPSAVLVGDFNGDGIPDFVVGDGEYSGAGVFLGNGDGTFTQTSAFGVGSFQGLSFGALFALGDFNGDGITDIAAAFSAGGDPDNVPIGGVGVLLGKGDGTFQPAKTTPISGWPSSILVADFNNDGLSDVVVDSVTETVPNCFGPCPPAASLLLGNGDGTFHSVPTPIGTAVGDFNGDGNADLVVNGSSGTTIYLGNGDGTFQSPGFSIPGISGPFVVADLNGDGNADLIGENSVALGNGDGTFQSPISFTSPGVSLIAGDFNGDGILDLAGISGNGVNIALGNGDGTFQKPMNYSPVTGGALASGDFNGDGRIDLAVVGVNNLTILLGTGVCVSSGATPQ